MRLKLGGLAAIVLLGSITSGCSTSPSSAPATVEPATPSPPAVASGTTSPGPVKVALSSRVLAATDLPAAIAGTRASLPADAVVGACNRVSLVTIGATRTSGAAYTGTGHKVTSAVAQLADEKTAALMQATLRSLHDKCALTTTAIAPVTGAAADSWRYVTTTAAGQAEGLGVAVSGRLMAVVSLSGTPQTVRAQLDELVRSAAKRIT